MGNTQSNLKFMANVAGMGSLLMSLFPKLIIKNPQVLRPLLNVSWGYLFGSSVWLCFFSDVGVIRTLTTMKKSSIPTTAEEAKTALEESKKEENDLKRRRMDFHYFFGLSTVFSGILLLTTVRLASQNVQLRISSTVVSVASLLNNLYLFNKIIKLKQRKEVLYNELIENPKDESIITSIKKNKKEFSIYHCMAEACMFLSLFGLTPYIFT